MRIINKTKNTVLADDVIVAATFFKRLKGLLGRKEFKRGKALILNPCNSIHTFFMRFAIDVAFVGSDNKIIFAGSSIRPWRLTQIFWQAKFCIELPSGVIAESMSDVGDEINLS